MFTLSLIFYTEFSAFTGYPYLHNCYIIIGGLGGGGGGRDAPPGPISFIFMQFSGKL